ncbi:MAG: aspartate kinase [Chitinivibrionales bacterium]|nr:aspartate kinase [Chitinivibrionales bacterium]MBD3395555.1 aspartate kinase [Chitinivibrionales bacterium]
MDCIVCKFGGTSVASSQRVEHIAGIVESDPRRRCVVLSAPGKAPGIDTKVTDLLIKAAAVSLQGANPAETVDGIKKRYEDIYVPLGLKAELVQEVLSDLDHRITADKGDPPRYRDAIVASGEDYNAKLFARYLCTRGIQAKYVSPADAGLVVTPEFGNAQPAPEAAFNLPRLKHDIAETIIVFPGFFGFTSDGDIATFSRGGSDLTGAICAEALDAAEYENWTDVDGIFSTSPKLVDAPEQIPALTYKEMRELSYIGFNVFHDEAVKPVLAKKIPIRLRNTNNLDNQGTLIVAERLPSERDVIGIASGGRFCSFTLQKFLLNREKGFGRKLLSIFEEMGLSYEHCPSGVDNISVILDQTQFKPETVNSIVRAIEDRLKPEELKTEFGIALVAVVGEGLLHKVGVLAQAAKAMSNAGINIKMVNQGSSEISMIFGIDAADEKAAVAALYNEFFKAGS